MNALFYKLVLIKPNHTRKNIKEMTLMIIFRLKKNTLQYDKYLPKNTLQYEKYLPPNVRFSILQVDSPIKFVILTTISFTVI